MLTDEQLNLLRASVSPLEVNLHAALTELTNRRAKDAMKVWQDGETAFTEEELERLRNTTMEKAHPLLVRQAGSTVAQRVKEVCGTIDLLTEFVTANKLAATPDSVALMANLVNAKLSLQNPNIEAWLGVQEDKPLDVVDDRNRDPDYAAWEGI